MIIPARPAARRDFRTALVLTDGTNADMLALVADELEAAVQVFHIRAGRIRGQRGFVVERVEDVSNGQLVESLLQQFYGGEIPEDVPREVLVSDLPADRETLTAWLRERRGGPFSLKSAGSQP